MVKIIQNSEGITKITSISIIRRTYVLYNDIILILKWVVASCVGGKIINRIVIILKNEFDYAKVLIEKQPMFYLK